MAGGTGTRFWPESRENNPKQFLPFFGRRTLFEETLCRIRPLIPKSRVIVVTQKRYESQVRRLGKIPPAHIIGEPVGRNTAPCVALAAALIIKKDPHAVLAILPSDHRIGKPARFRKILKRAAETAAQHGFPVTFGMKATLPHTGYGYLEIDKLFKKENGMPIYRLKRFHEKPTLAKAKAFLKTGRFLWNSGMFVWHADQLLEATRDYLPGVYKVVQNVIPRSGATKDLRDSSPLPGLRMTKALEKFYPRMPSISIDYGLMEPLRGKILTIPADIEWCDLGGWQAFQDLWPRDLHGNIIQGKQILTVGCQDNLVRTGKRLMALVGVRDLVVVDTEDALLIASQDKVESIREIVAMLRKRGWTKYL